ncbi:phosphoribosylamine--glycine ligase [Leptospira wolffii]|uniref:phosphoribosylamine--glycine ligase n=1 Tax=Leptospira wolffii TaxID=409998 RepID=UPI001082A13C|nr:phosphoribosylamine--glycine ligase [Leptospira wolffii]TGK58219.1 phosphoribosylamine--glycine ligase [Leptospira wolffii]TGK66405.1 phosphoribosylamine--glycine ligase [Leptospira wolffii]TGK68897.1 phosphoribosylamine--glycine ligase [Leptospira wolffii]TGL27249.1 phosphoribosylamine--glycine ligase [Leptospira wolffii]
MSNILLIGSGGRESALAYKLRQSPKLRSLHVFPGNGGFPDSELLPPGSFDLKSKASVQNFIQKNKYDLVVVGPEDPLVDGIGDWLAEIGVPVFGPSAFCAQIEGSKEFAKALMVEAGVPTAKYASFVDYESALSYVRKEGAPIVIKADGLAAGKGVTVALELSQAESALKEIFLDKKFGSSGNKVVIEEFMEGQEASIFAISDGEIYFTLPAAQDHKRAYDGDQGPNTGGMGAYCPAPIVTEKVLEKVNSLVFQPVFSAFRKKGHPYKGLLYAGLMIDSEGNPKVVEFNCRFGDPETQCVLPMLEGDLVEIFLASAKGALEGVKIGLRQGASTVVVLAAEGYPDSYAKNIPLDLPQSGDSDLVVFHAGTAKKDGNLISTGGRILGISSYGKDLKDSVDKAYAYLRGVHIPKTFFRKDIAKKAL